MMTATDKQRREADASTAALLDAAAALADADAALVRRLTAERARLLAKGRRHSSPPPRATRWLIFARHVPAVPLGK